MNFFESLPFFNISSDLFDMFIEGFNALGSAFVSPMSELYNNSQGLDPIFQQGLNDLLTLLGIDASSITLAGFILGPSLILILIITLVKWVIGIVT